MESLIRLQTDFQKKIFRSFTNFKKSPKERITKSYIETRLEDLEKQWSMFESTHRAIITGYTSEEVEKAEYTRNDKYGEVEQLYFDYKTTLKEALAKCSKSDNINEGKESGNAELSPRSNVKLPKISIPTFSGRYQEWPTFRDMFMSLIHNNNSLSDVEKLRYLKNYLTGEAEQLLRHLPITNENYKTCWNTLEHSYNNKKFVSDAILKRFFSQKCIASESYNCLKEMFNTTNECLNGLKNLGLSTEELWDLTLIHLLSTKLDGISRRKWEAKTCSLANELPKLSEFLEFLEHRFRSLEFLAPKVTNKQTKSQHVVNTVINKESVPCLFCSNNNHKLGNCKSFAKEDLLSRRNFVQNSKLCFNCLGRNHSVTACRLPTRCRICGKKHHSLLHSDQVNQSTGNKELTQTLVDDNSTNTVTPLQDNNQVNNVTTCFSNTGYQVVLATALVHAESKSGNNITLRSLLDQGSQAPFITEAAAQLLGLKRTNNSCVINGVGGDNSPSLRSKQVVYVKLQSVHDPNFVIQVKTHVLDKLTSFLPERRIVVQSWPNLPEMKLADPKFYTPNRIDLLLGAEVYCQIIAEGVIKSPSGSLVAQNTKLGWILSGKVKGTNVNSSESSCSNTIISMHITNNNETYDLRKFWEIESDNFSLTKQFTEEEEKCEHLFQKTTTRDSTGRYIVKLPFRVAEPRCKYGNSRDIAIKRFMSLEKRFLKSQDLKSHYIEVMEEYLKLGHMHLVPKEEINKPSVYLPYHEVVRNDKTTTKFRVVFNASSLDNNGVSLNSELMVGPTLQSELRHILMKWRFHPICLVADIVKMYRQVKVSTADADYQRIVWRANPNQELQHICLNRVTFGTASAPYLAVRSLHQVSYDEGTQFPLAAERVLHDFYMDDLLTGCQTATEGKQIVNEIKQLLSKGGFEVQKWSSNNELLLEEIKESKVTNESNLELKQDEIIKILGLTWNRQTDDFEYSVKLPPLQEPVTKRSIISDIARLFDPIGWIAPAIITAKIMIQRIWLSGINWDEELPPLLLNDWIIYRNELNELTKFKIPRWMNVNTKVEDLELHGFSDASNEAYAAAVYLRIVDHTGKVHVHLITSKTRVAPIRQVSIPRLELCGAVLLAKLLQEVSVVLDIPKIKIKAWTDSTVVLAWLSSHPSRWKTFIANRVSEILNILDRNQWAHVSSSDNPADCASRGLKPSELLDCQLWKLGPPWLKELTLDTTEQINLDTNLEEKQKKSYHVVEKNKLELWNKYSSLRKLTRVVSYCRRFIIKSRKPQETKFPTWLTSDELKKSLQIIIKQCQKEHFPEIKNIKEKGFVNNKSKLTSLNPFLDTAEILRVGGRLERADVNAGNKHPIILPSESHLTNLIIAEAHENTLHGGPQLMINYLRTKYWILNARNRVKQFVRKCVVCVRHAAITRNQLMGQLPSARITPSRPFCRSGVDYAGPIQIRTSKGRGHRAYKGYICLFVCMATRAIHLEAVSDLTAQGFLAAFKRFVARRGHCEDLFSDNGTNFVGASRELKTLFAQEKSTLTMEIANCLSNNGTNWHFIPPHSPHFGGLWEAGVKSTKHHLRRVIGNATLTYEELSTLLHQIEACLNSRPLSKLSTDPQDPVPLTPGHFLIGEPLVLLPDANYESSSVSSLKRWQLTQKMLQHFWRRWSTEYLSQFMHRYRWANHNPEPQIGDLVLVKEDGLPPAKWLIGIITEKHTGLDNITRVVTLKCKGMFIKRSVAKLCVLPITN